MLGEDSLFNGPHIKISEKNSERGAHGDTINLIKHLSPVRVEGRLHGAQTEKVS